MEDCADLTIVDSYKKSFLASPCLVSFEYGSLAKDEAAKLQCEMYIDKKIPDNHTLVVSKGNQRYKGKLKSNPICQTLLLIRNKKNNKARLFSAYSCLLESALKERTQQKSITPLERSTDINNLSQMFGSKKAKRISDLNMRMKVSTSDLQDDVKKVISEMDIKSKDLDIKSDDTIMHLLPPCNRDAEIVEDVYKAEDLLNEFEMNSLDKCVAALNDENEPKSEYLQLHCNKLGSNASVEKLKLLSYADSLLRFVNMGAIEIKNKNCLRNICPASRVIGTKILNEFTVLTGNTRNRPVSYKDKAVCCIMILTLLTCNYRMELDRIAALLKGYHQNKLLQLCKTVGVVAALESGKKVYILKLPLPKLPTLPNKNKKKTL